MIAKGAGRNVHHRILGLLMAVLLLPFTAAAQSPNEALRQAAKAGDLKAARAALDAGAEVDTKDDYSITPLMLTVRQGNVELAKLLLDKGADINAKDTFYGVNVLSEAARSGNSEIVALLLDRGASGGTDLLRTAVRQGDVATVKVFVEKGKLTEAQKKTALRQAKQFGQEEIAKIFEEAGVTLVMPATPASDGPAATPVPDADRLAALARMNEKIALPAEKKSVEPMHWPMFRGPQASGVADGQHPPTAWDTTKNENVKWRTDIPGLALSSPIIWGERMFLTTAVSAKGEEPFRHGLYGDVDSVNDDSAHTWKVLCLDRKTGEIIWDQTAHEGVPAFKRHTKSSHANSTMVTDGERVVAFFASEGMHCYDMDGKLLWKKDLGKLDSGWFFDPSYQWGFAASPILYKGMIILQCDVQSNPFIAAFRIEDGSEIWRTARNEITSWGTPNVIEHEGHAEVVTNGTKGIRGYDPMTGAELWTLSPNSEVTAPTPIFAHGLIYVTSGYRPIQPIYAIRPGQKGDISLAKGETSSAAIAWSVDKGGPYMPTPIVYGDYLYTCANNGILTCWDAKNGEVKYKKRLGHMGGGYSASPVAADGRIYFPSEDGEVFVVRAGAEYELLATNPMGEVIMATPAISDGIIYVRTLKAIYGIGQ
jgi:outer membrane protein assembly factor BamB